MPNTVPRKTPRKIFKISVIINSLNKESGARERISAAARLLAKGAMQHSGRNSQKNEK